MFGGHEHLYERISPQKGIRYFVSGGGGRNLYRFRRSDFDEVGISQHHFMVVQIDGDRLLFEAITPQQKLLDCGILYRTADAEEKPLNAETQKWLNGCQSSRPITTAEGQR